MCRQLLRGVIMMEKNISKGVIISPKSMQWYGYASRTFLNLVYICIGKCFVFKLFDFLLAITLTIVQSRSKRNLKMSKCVFSLLKQPPSPGFLLQNALLCKMTITTHGCTIAWIEKPFISVFSSRLLFHSYKVWARSHFYSEKAGKMIS